MSLDRSRARTDKKSQLDEIDFFGSSRPRTADERKKRIEAFVPDSAKRADFVAYGRHYFDDPQYGVGYGGYHYDGRYVDSVDKMIAHYGLKEGSSILELGCAKGFILYEFFKRGMKVTGIDLSTYAVENAKPEVKPFIVNGSCDRLQWPAESFDFVYSKEMLPHLNITQLVATVAEARRVCKTNNIFFEIQVGNDDESRQLITAWDETHRNVKSADWWRNFLGEQNFQGQVNFKNLF